MNFLNIEFVKYSLHWGLLSKKKELLETTVIGFNQKLLAL